MAKMGGCNYEWNSAKGAQGTTRVTPADWSRNSLSKGGVNKNAAGSDKFVGKPKLGKGKADDGKG